MPGAAGPEEEPASPRAVNESSQAFTAYLCARKSTTDYIVCSENNDHDVIELSISSMCVFGASLIFPVFS